ncbi:MAG: TIGR02206 family membrane protein [Deltaproteobacteria bacterium]|nr:TIGR02206 family membrane protein [Deltaproteobacteria bacterium]
MIENFSPFNTVHGFILILSIVFVIVVLIFARRLPPKYEVFLRTIFCALVWGQEITLYYFRYTQEILSLSEHLPLHMCSLSVLLIPIALFKKTRTLSCLLYFWGMGGATQALLTPTVTAQTNPFLFYQFFISHTFIVLGALYPIFIYCIKPSRADLKKSIMYTILILPFIGLVNWLVQGNYFYLSHKPEAKTLLDALGPWPIYIIPLIGIGIGLFSLLYLPFELRKSNKTNTKQEK